MRPTVLRGAHTHNLKGIDLLLDPGSLVCIAGPSGAGKSSLAFGTLYAEGQRRYVESFSAYARQFLERLARPPVDELDPVSVGIAVDRQAPVRTSRSTVGTMTDINDYLKTLWARVAILQCPECGMPVTRDAPEQVADELLEQAATQRLLITYPVPVDGPEGYLLAREELLADGYRRLVVDGDVRDLDEVPPSEALREGGELAVVADRTVARRGQRGRLVDSLESAMHRGGGRVDVHVPGAGSFHYSRGLHCPRCDRSFREATPGLFSFNSPVGACETCRGFGRTIGLDFDRVIPDRSLSLAEGAVRAWRGKSHAWERRKLREHAERAGIPMDMPVAELDTEHWRWLLEGDGRGWRRGWFGIEEWFRWMESRAYKMHVRVFLSRYRKYDVCAACSGTRLRPEALAWRVDGLTLPELAALPVDEVLDRLRRLARLHRRDPAIGLLLRECQARLSALSDVGLGYLSLDRQSRTLSGGEAQRAALTSALGASLNGAMFVLDEPTVGLHPRDVDRLLGVVRRLATGENIALVVEHDPAVLRGSDRVVELGPGAGEHGGRVVFDGTPAELETAGTATGRALAPGDPVRRSRRTGTGEISLRLRGARGNNLAGVDLDVPVGAMTCVTGVSGSGKSTLILGTLVPAVQRALGHSTEEPPLPFEALVGAGELSTVVQVDQAPLGRTSRGNPATYLKVWDAVRKRFAAEPLSRQRGYKPGFFSFNVPGGRCEACRGEGAETVEMQFLADVTFGCPECGGRRFVGKVLDVRHRGHDIADILDLTASDAASLFADDREVSRRLAPLLSVGLGYLRLGQPLNTLSGGEAQRLKLAEALGRASGGALIVLDEPTAGLHADDVTPLLSCMEALVERGDTVVVVEHDMRVAARADRVVDLGPGAGAP